MNYQTVLNSFGIFHEVGHVIVAKKLGIEIDYISIEDGDGCVKVNTVDFESKTVLEKITFYIAGEAAFDYWKDLHSTNCKITNKVYNDYKFLHAVDDQNKIIKILTQESSLFKVVIFRKIFVTLYKMYAYKIAYQMIKNNKQASLRLKSEIYKNKRLDGYQIDRII